MQCRADARSSNEAAVPSHRPYSTIDSSSWKRYPPRALRSSASRKSAALGQGVRALRRELAHRVEERPRPTGLPLERLRETDQVARAAGIELDHAAGREPIVGTDQAALRGLPILRRRRQVDAEERAVMRGTLRSRRFDRCRPTPQQHADEPPRDDLDANGHLVDLLPLHAA